MSALPEYVLMEHLTRRRSLGLMIGSVAACACSRTASAQSINSVSASGSCWLTRAEATQLGPDLDNSGSFVTGNEDIIPRTGNGSFDRALAHSLARLTEAFGVIPGFAFFKEQSASSANAFATPEIRMDRQDGTVLFGSYLFKQLIALRDAPDAAILAVCAHEYGHIVQNKFSLRHRLLDGQSTVCRLELHADFLSGYFAGLRKRANENFAAATFAVTMASLGDTDYNNKGHHGTPDERAKAIQAGYGFGKRSAQPFADIVEAGAQYVGA